MKTALVLGGGGARGLAHLGVIRVLEEAGIKPDLIVGCSIGAIVGAMYAQHPDSNFVLEKIEKFLAGEAYEDLNIDVLLKHRNGDESKDFIHQVARNAVKRVMLNMVASRVSILKEEPVEKVIESLIEDGNIEDTVIPFACNATDLMSGQPVLFHEGNIRFAVKASSSIPGYLPPVQQDSQVLVDGAVTYSLPVKFARMLGADLVIAVNVKQQLQTQAEYRNVFDIILRANAISASLLAEEITSKADISISPMVGEFMWYDFKDKDLLLKAGEDAAYLHLDEIRQHMKKNKEGFWGRLFSSRRAG